MPRADGQPRPVATLLILTEPWSLGVSACPCLGQVTRSDLRNSPHMSARRHPPDEGLKCRGCSGMGSQSLPASMPPALHTTHVRTTHLHCASVHTLLNTRWGGGEGLSAPKLGSWGQMWGLPECRLG